MTREDQIPLPALRRARAISPTTRTWMTRRLQPWSEVATLSERCMQLAQQISPWTLSQELEEQPVIENAKVIQEVARNETQQVRKQTIKPEPQRVAKIDEVRLRTSSRFPRSDSEGHRAGPTVEVQFVEKRVSVHRVKHMPARRC